MAGRPWGSAGLLLHPHPEVLEPPLGDVDVGLREGASALLQGMEKHEQVPRPLVQHPIQVPPVVTPQFPELAVDLRAMRERERRSLLATRFRRLIVKSISSCRSGGRLSKKSLTGSRPSESR